MLIIYLVCLREACSVDGVSEGVVRLTWEVIRLVRSGVWQQLWGVLQHTAASDLFCQRCEGRSPLSSETWVVRVPLRSTQRRMGCPVAGEGENSKCPQWEHSCGWLRATIL